MIESAFAHVLKTLRCSKGLSQEELSFRTGLHRTYVSQLERGLKSPSLRTLESLAGALDIHLSELMALVEKEIGVVHPIR